MLDKVLSNPTVKSLATSLLVGDSRNSTSEDPDTVIQKSFPTVSQADLEHWVTELSFPRDFHLNKLGNDRARELVKSEFERFGLTTFVQDGVYGNVIAMLPGMRPEGAVLIGAHFDGFGETPGADDNASAVSAMLGCAQALAEHFPEYNIGFVGFNAEESDPHHQGGLFGSTEFVKDLVQGKIPGIKSIKEAYVLEMVGYFSSEEGSQHAPPGMPVNLPSTGDFLGVVTNGGSRRIGKQVRVSAATYTPEFPVLTLHLPFGVERTSLFRDTLRSDHSSFWDRKIPGNTKGIPAIMLTDTANFRNSRYHGPNDTPDTLHYPSLEKVYKLVTAASLARAERS